MASTGVMSVLGFVFWIIIARFYDAHEVGLATAMISVMGLITNLSTLGLNVALIRFLPNSKRKNDMINTAFTLTIIVTILMSTFYLLISFLISPDLLFIQENLYLSLLFIFFMVISVIYSLLESIFISYRESKYNFISKILFSLSKLFLPFIFILLGIYTSLAIFSSWMISMFLGIIFLLYILIKNFEYKPKFNFYKSIFTNIGKYSIGSYIAGFLGGLPATILPLMITYYISPSHTAFYFIAMQIAILLYTIPTATTNSLFAEGSYDEKKLSTLVKKTAKIIYIILLPSMLLIVLFGKYILILFGLNYSLNATYLLTLFAFSSIFFVINRIGENYLKIKKKINLLILTGFLRAFFILISVYYLIHLGLVGVGYGWLIGVALTSLTYIVIYFSINK